MRWLGLLSVCMACEITNDNSFVDPLSKDTSMESEPSQDEDTQSPSTEPDEPEDLDQDGYSVEEGDCDDNNPEVNPGIEENPGGF